MTRPARTSGARLRGIPKTRAAFFKLVGTALLAGLVCGASGGGIALALGLHPFIAAGASGAVGALVVAWVILRYGQSE